MEQQQWYYSRVGQQLGPVDVDVLRQLFVAGQVTPNDLVWCEGMANWQPASTVPTFFAPAPPSPDQPNYVTPLNYHGAQPYGAGMLSYGHEARYAGFWLRFCAAFVDGIVLNVVQLPISLGLGINPFDNTYRAAPGPFLLNQTLAFVIAWLYMSLQESSTYQGTLGKRAVGIKVTDLQGGRITFGRATGRHFAKILSYLTLGIGFLMAAFTQRKQALHDQVADCLVIRKQ